MPGDTPKTEEKESLLSKYGPSYLAGLVVPGGGTALSIAKEAAEALRPGITSSLKDESKSFSQGEQSIQLFNKKTGQAVRLSPEDAHAAFQTGNFGFQSGARVPVKSADGSVGTVPAEKVEDFLDNYGGQLAGEQELAASQNHDAREAKDQELQEKYGSTGSELRAAGEGALRNLTLGASDWVQGKVLGNREEIAKRKEANPWASGVGEIGGLAAGTFLGGEEKAAVSEGKEVLGVARTAEEAFGLAGKAVDDARAAVNAKTAAASEAAIEVKKAEEALNTAKSAPAWGSDATRAASQRSVATAAENFQKAQGLEASARADAGAAETALDAAQADHIQAAKTLASDPSALQKGISKAFEYSPTGLVGKAGKAIENSVRDALGVDSSTGLLGRSFGKAAALGLRGAFEGGVFGMAQQLDEDYLGDANTTSQKLLASIGHGALYGLAGGAVLGGGGELVGSALRNLGKSIPGTADRLSNEMAWKALAPTKSMTERAESKVKGGIRAIGKTLNEEGVIGLGDTTEQIAEKVDAKLDELNLQRAEIVGASGARVGASEILKPINSIIEKTSKDALSEPVVSKLKQYRDSIAQKLGIMTDDGQVIHDADVSIADLLKQRQVVAGVAHQEFKALDPNRTVQGLRDMASEMEKIETKYLQDASISQKHPQFAEYKAIKTKMSHLITAQETLKKTQSAAKTNQGFSLKDMIGGGIGSEIAGHIGDRAAEATGALVAGPAGFVAGSVLNHLARERGRSTAAVLLRKVADLGAIHRTVAEVDEKIAGAVDSLISSSTKKKAGKIAAGAAKKAVRGINETEDSTRDRYEKRVEQVKRAVAQPEEMGQLITPMVEHAPKTAAALGETVKRATIFLSSKLPQQHIDSLTPQAKSDIALDSVHQFLRYSDAVDDPVKVLDHVSDGTATGEEIEAINAVYPDMMNEVRSDVASKLADKKEPLSMQKETQLRLFLGAPGGSLDPAFVTQMQASYGGAAPSAGPPNGGGKKGGVRDKSGSFKNSINVMTRAQEMMNVSPARGT